MAAAVRGLSARRTTCLARAVECACRGAVEVPLPSGGPRRARSLPRWASRPGLAAGRPPRAELGRLLRRRSPRRAPRTQPSTASSVRPERGLKPLMLRTPDRDSTSSTCGRGGPFTADSTDDAPPAPDMARAPLNMMTRTSAAGLPRRGYHDSVDTGWVGDEDARLTSRSKRPRKHGFSPPLTSSTAPLSSSIDHHCFNTGEHLWASSS